MADAGGLVLADVVAGYGETVVLEHVGLSVAPGGALALLGRNGVGKTTLLGTIMGHTTLHSGSITLDGMPLSRRSIFRRARAGIGLVPQEREIFASLTVMENLTVAARGTGWTPDQVFDLFPNLARRRGNRGNELSGGEQQMLAVGRALMCNPRFLLLDEPLEGLAPVMVDALMAALHRLRSDRLAMILVEQHAQLALDFAAEALVLDRGRVVYGGPSAPLRDDAQRVAELMGVAERR